MSQPTGPSGTIPEHPDLFGMLRGELDNATIAAAADHLRRCDECVRDLIDVTVGHALLTAATHTLTPPEPATIPTLAASAPIPPSTSRRVTAMLLAAAAVVAVVLGAWAWSGRNQPAPDQPPAARAQLEPLVEGETSSGEVTMAAEGDSVAEMTISTQDLPALPRDEFYYAWLFDPDTNKMLPLGQIGPSGTATFELPVSLLGSYSAIDISLEVDDGDPEHSVTSVLRATYDPSSAVAES